MRGRKRGFRRAAFGPIAQCAFFELDSLTQHRQFRRSKAR